MLDEHTKICTDCDVEIAAIAGLNEVTSVLGYWPCFHNAIFESFHLDRSGSGPGTDIRAEFIAHRTLSEVNERGFYKLVDHTRITFLFRCAYLRSLSLDCFPDVVIDFAIRKYKDITDAELPIEVRFVTSGLVEIDCRAAEVISAVRMPDVANQ